MTEATPSPELKRLCKFWIPFLLKEHKRYGEWNKREMAIGDSELCMVAEAWKWDRQYMVSCSDCVDFANAFDTISQNNRGNNIRPTQVNRMIRKGNTFATHFVKKHA